MSKSPKKEPTKKKPINKKLFTIAAITGAAAGLASMLYVLILYWVGENPFGRYQYLVVAVLSILFAIGFITYRDKYNNRRLRSREAILLGFGISSVATLVYALLVFVFLSYTDTGKESLEIYKQELYMINDRGLKERPEQITEELHTAIKQNIEETTSSEMTLKEFRFSLSSGALLTIMMTFIFRYNPKT